MAAFTLAAISDGMDVILCAVLACSAPLAITSASSLPSMTALQPGIKSPQRSTFAIVTSSVLYPPDRCSVGRPRRHDPFAWRALTNQSVSGAKRAVNPQEFLFLRAWRGVTGLEQ